MVLEILAADHLDQVYYSGDRWKSGRPSRPGGRTFSFGWKIKLAIVWSVKVNMALNVTTSNS